MVAVLILITVQMPHLIAAFHQPLHSTFKGFQLSSIMSMQKVNT